MSLGVLRIMLSIFLGVITTVAVSCGLGYFHDIAEGEEVSWGMYESDSPVQYKWIVSTTRQAGMEVVFYRCFNTMSSGLEFPGLPLLRDEDVTPNEAAPAWSRFRDIKKPDPTQLPDRKVDVASGWPFLAMWGGFDVQNPSTIKSTHYLVVAGYRPPLIQFQIAWTARVIPLAPIWFGFVLDTGLYTIIWIITLLAVAQTRRVIRKMRGRCPKCAYDLRGDFESGCSECGWNRTETEKREVEQ